MNKIKATIAALTVFMMGMAPALADQRTSVVLAAPVPLNSTTYNNAGIGLSYTLAKAGPLEIAPFVVAENIADAAHKNGGFHVLPGLQANLAFGRVTLGIGEVLKPNAKVNLDASHYTPNVLVGIKL